MNMYIQTSKIIRKKKREREGGRRKERKEREREGKEGRQSEQLTRLDLCGDFLPEGLDFLLSLTFTIAGPEAI